MHLLIVEERAFIQNGDGSEELYDLRADPHERFDLADSREAQDDLARFRGLLRRLVRAEPPADSPEISLPVRQENDARSE